MKYLLLSITVLIIVSGCCPSYIGKPEIIHDTLRVSVPADVVFDTVYAVNGQGESIRYIVKIDTVKDTDTLIVRIKGKERVIYVPHTDTVTVYRESPPQKTWLDKVVDLFGQFKWIILSIALVLALIIIGYIVYRVKR